MHVVAVLDIDDGHVLHPHRNVADQLVRRRLRVRRPDQGIVDSGSEVVNGQSDFRWIAFLCNEDGSGAKFGVVWW